MPTRILYWNIQDFARNKIANPGTQKNKRKQSGSSLTLNDASIDRFTHILWLINTVNPDIVVVVETETAWDGRGRIVRGNGLEGAKTLLRGIRNVTGNNAWMLVPPLQTGPNEGVSVFYDSTQRYFTGPYVWPGGGAATAQPPGAGPGNYPGAIRSRLPNRVIPGGALHNGGASERQVAASVSFTYAAHLGGPLAGTPIAYGVARAPYMVTFTETDGGGAVQRNLTLFAVHSPASFTANAYLQGLADVAEIVDNIAANEVRVVMGDFNVNLLTLAHVQNANYNALTGQGYALALQPLGAAPAPLVGYEGYFATHILPTVAAEYWSTNTQTVYYPGYGYIGSHRIANFYAIDNIFTMYGGGVAPPLAGNRFTIMNPIVGSPFNVHAVPAVGTPIGSLPLAIDMVANTNPPAQGPPFSLGLYSSFTGWEEYGHIRSVSDHLSLAIDV